MSIEEKRNVPETSAQAIGGTPLTVSNLAEHNRDASTTTAAQAVRSWLNDTETSSGRYVDDETWAETVGRDALAADIEATLRGGNQSVENRK